MRRTQTLIRADLARRDVRGAGRVPRPSRQQPQLCRRRAGEALSHPALLGSDRLDEPRVGEGSRRPMRIALWLS